MMLINCLSVNAVYDTENYLCTRHIRSSFFCVSTVLTIKNPDYDYPEYCA